MVDNQSLQNLENLHRMKSEGIITEEEFERSKERILFGGNQAAGKATVTAAHSGDQDHIAWILMPLRRYAQFEGRSSRREFWMFQLLYIAIFVSAFLVVAIDTHPIFGIGTIGTGAIALMLLAFLALLVPLLAVEARRFHDQDRSGWFVLLNLIPYAGALIVLVMMLLPGTAGTNRFGADPLGKADG